MIGQTASRWGEPRWRALLCDGRPVEDRPFCCLLVTKLEIGSVGTRGTKIGTIRNYVRVLGGDMAGIVSARRGTYRVIYRINEPAREVVVLRIEHLRALTHAHPW